jgi:hypothetical protein
VTILYLHGLRFVSFFLYLFFFPSSLFQKSKPCAVYGTAFISSAFFPYIELLMKWGGGAAYLLSDGSKASAPPLSVAFYIQTQPRRTALMKFVSELPVRIIIIRHLDVNLSDLTAPAELVPCRVAQSTIET